MRNKSKARLWCCACAKDVDASMITGARVYPRRKELHHLSYWTCETCSNYVGCHKGTIKPLGVIPTPELRLARQFIHKILDPIWRKKKMTRSAVYGAISRSLGYAYHTAEIKQIEEARKIYVMAIILARKVNNDRAK